MIDMIESMSYSFGEPSQTFSIPCTTFVIDETASIVLPLMVSNAATASEAMIDGTFVDASAVVSSHR